MEVRALGGWGEALPYERGRERAAERPAPRELPPRPQPVVSSQASTPGEYAIDLRVKREAFFAVDNNGHVVIRIVDEQGEVIEQIPAEAHLRATAVVMAHLDAGVDRKA